MKTIIALVIVGGFIVAFVYYAGGYGSFDPSKQGRDAKAAITPGMSWKNVAAVAGETREYRPYRLEVRGEGANQRQIVLLGAPNKLSADALAKRIADGGLPYGFAFHYRFSESVAFQVQFDQAGNVVAVNDLTTVADLLQMGK